MPLKNGAVSESPRLDRVYEEDWRSLDFPVAIPVRRPRSYSWRCNVWLDQGQTGQCVGHGYSHDLAARPVEVTGADHDYATGLYYQAQQEDPWEGGEYPGATPVYSGTSVLTGAKVMKERGFYSEYRWALDLKDLVMGIGLLGPAILGLNWLTDMEATDATGRIHATGAVVGGHCLLARGCRIRWIDKKGNHDWENVDLDASTIILHNSWGKDWGVDGEADVSLKDMGILLAANGEACFPTRVPTKKTV